MNQSNSKAIDLRIQNVMRSMTFWLNK